MLKNALNYTYFISNEKQHESRVISTVIQFVFPFILYMCIKEGKRMFDVEKSKTSLNRIAAQE